MLLLQKKFKTIYFPASDFLGARLGHNPSFVWRSIYTSHVVVKGGIRWCIGDGQSIEIWGETSCSIIEIKEKIEEFGNLTKKGKVEIYTKYTMSLFFYQESISNNNLIKVICLM
jgi:hypothetical protein